MKKFIKTCENMQRNKVLNQQVEIREDFEKNLDMKDKSYEADISVSYRLYIC